MNNQIHFLKYLFMRERERAGGEEGEAERIPNPM